MSVSSRLLVLPFGDEHLTTKLHATAQLIKDFRIALDNGRSHSLIVDQANEASTGLGATPLELCVMSHAGCYASILALVAERMRIALRGLTVKVIAAKTDAAGTITEEEFDIAIRADAPQDRIQRLHEVTLRNCPVGVIFERANTKISYNIKLSNE